MGDSRFCCVSSQGAFRCLQFGAENKCLDCRGDGTICHESIDSTICCFCITGASKAWAGCSDCDPLLSGGQTLCCDNRMACPPSALVEKYNGEGESAWGGISCCGMHIAGSKFGSCAAGSAPAEAAKPAEPEAAKE